MKEAKQFDLVESPLEGANLIEASAGTGKTYVLAGLFVRLILEKRLSVNEILVVTYTVAATEELRDRIRKKLREALDICSGAGGGDRFLEMLVLRVGRKEAARLLRDALHDFDEAPVFTIHGFCQRMLHENAFESGELFDTELITDETALREEIVRDFWRTNFYNAPVELVAYARSRKLSAKFFLELLEATGAHPDMKITPEVEPGDLDPFIDRFRLSVDAVRTAWRRARSEVIDQLGSPALHAGQYRNRQGLVLLMDLFLSSGEPLLPLFSGFEKFTPAVLERFTKKNHAVPEHPFFHLCEDLRRSAAALQNEMDRHLLYLKREAFMYLQRELPARKRRRNVQSFDDLLVRLRRALEKAQGGELAGAIRRKYRAALIDEFQDTDPVQYAIFHNVFGAAGRILFLIGDPKQAIYSFRGADLFAYIKASGLVDNRYTLARNWRSEPDLVTAVNAVFLHAKNPFLYEEIPFEPAAPEENRDIRCLTVDGASEPPLRIWLVRAEEIAKKGKSAGKSAAKEVIANAVAREISRLIHLGRSGRALIGEEPVREADIAVIVRKNSEARIIQDALRVLDVPGVIYSMGNIFDTREAEELKRIVSAIAEPGREALMRAALVTDMLGVGGEEMESLLADEIKWEERVARFREYYDIWEKYGFIRMFRLFLSREMIRARLLAYPDGQRRLTNVLHLSEILHQESSERKLGIIGLLRWFSRQCDPDSPRLEEHQLRLEGDENAVRIVTIHKSKGLEYPIVFCPFQWDGSRVDRTEKFTYHDRDDDWRLHLVLDADKNPKRILAEKEQLAENLRLLYVAMTRARNRCYIVWGRIRDAGSSSLSYIFHPPDAGSEDIVEAAEARFDGLADEDIRREIELLAAKGGSSILLSEMPTSVAPPAPRPAERLEAFNCRSFSGVLERDFRVASFSFLIAGRPGGEPPAGGDADFPDYDSDTDDSPPLGEESGSGIFAFPRGARAGTLFHNILEEIDYTTREDSVLRKIVSGKLMEHGFDLKWEDAICEMIAKILAIPLDPAEEGLLLSNIPAGDRLNELGFHFPLKPVTPASLRSIITRHGGAEVPDGFPERIGDLNFAPSRGYMKGYMDLVFRFRGRFYLVDWKSNFLGNRREDYGPEALSAVMKSNYYILQYYIYTLALHRYLRMRVADYDYERHFGGIFYIFLRGAGSADGIDYGIYRDRPSGRLIRGLESAIAAGEP